MATFTISKDGATSASADVLAVPVYEDLTGGPGAKEVERALGTTIAELAERLPLITMPHKQFKGKLGQAILATTFGKLAAANVVFVGMGPKARVGHLEIRRAGATVARRSGGAVTIATTIPLAGKGAADSVRAFVEGFELGSYRFLQYRAEKDTKPNRIESVQLIPDKKWDSRQVKAAIERAQALVEGTVLARDLKNTPSSDKSPESLAATARTVARNGLKVSVLDEKELEKKGFGGILGVGRGSRKPPRLIQLRYEPKGAKRTVAIVGKGITFDSGGISLKPAEGMDAMKMDMGGGAAVLGAMLAISKLKPKVAVHGYIATAENMPGGDATRPGDIITHYGGKTTEVGNTDAEGRLVMADAIVYAREQGADVVLDIATLTGAARIALGSKIFGVIGEPRSEVAKVLAAADRAGEPAWELPLHTDYTEVMRSDIADLSNIAKKNIGAGAITAGLFLKEFAGDTPWVHLDIAGPMIADEDLFEHSKGATGVGVRTLVEYVMAQ